MAVCLSSCKVIHSTFNIGEHTYEYIQYEAGHFKQYTCGCPSPEIIELHFDNDDNGVCDVCNYYLVESILLSSQEEWLNEISAENVTQIQTVHGDFGEMFGMYRISTVTDKDDIAKIIEIYQAIKIQPLDPAMPCDITTESFQIFFTLAQYLNLFILDYFKRISGT